MTPFVPSRRPSRRGFTLIEAAMAMVILGVAVAAMLQLLAAGTQSNLAGAEMTTAINLANNIREIANGLAFTDPTNAGSTSTKESTPAQYNDIWDLDGSAFKPPLDCSSQSISNYAQWKQVVSVQSVKPDRLDATRPNDPTIPTARITVTIYHGPQYVYKTSWVVCTADHP